MKRLVILYLSSILGNHLLQGSTAFVLSPAAQVRLGSVILAAKKKRNQKGASKGFGTPAKFEQDESSLVDEKPIVSTKTEKRQESEQPLVLKSVEQGGSDAIPTTEAISPEERTKRILREQYGMKSLDEQQRDAKQQKALEEDRKRWNDLKKKAESENFDIMKVLPAPLLIAFDRFLKAGVVITGTLFVLAGLGITWEAWSKTSGEPIPEGIDSFITNVVEPNFTPGLLVLLGFSVSLGLFAAAQLGSEGAQYKEDN